MPLARHQRADRKDLAARTARARAPRRIVGARHHHGDARAIDAEVGDEALGRGFAGDDQPMQAAVQPLLHATQRFAFGFGEAGFQRGGMVDQADRAARRQRILHAREGRQRQSVDHRARCIGEAVPRGTRRIARGIVGQRKCPREFHHAHRVALRAQFRHHAAIVAIATGDLVERRRNDEGDVHHAIGPSQTAHACGPARRRDLRLAALHRWGEDIKRKPREKLKLAANMRHPAGIGARRRPASRALRPASIAPLLEAGACTCPQDQVIKRPAYCPAPAARAAARSA